MKVRKDNLKDFNPIKDKKSGFTRGEKFRPLKSLLKYIKDNNIKPEKINIRSMNHQERRSSLCSIEMAEHWKRIRDANLDYPIIINWDGMVVDGFHRITKSLVEGKKNIKAYRINLLDIPSMKVNK